MKTGLKLLVLTAMVLGLFMPGSVQPVLAEKEFSCANVTEIPQIECEALVAFYNSTHGDEWNRDRNWFETNVPSDWYGLFVEDGHVKGIYFGTGFLPADSTLPPEIGHLTELVEIKIRGLSGSIPAEIGNITSLEHLEMPAGNLTGSLPVEMGNLTHLAFLDLTLNKLSGSIPESFGNLTSLTVLGLSNNMLTGSIPSVLGNLVNLKTLHLAYNSLTGSIPPELGNLSELDGIYLFHNRLSGSIPPELGNLSKLRGIGFESNQFSGQIPPELGNLQSLTSLRLFANRLSGTIPVELTNLSQLTNLELYGNQLTGTIPPELGNLHSLKMLNLSRNQLTGTIPPELGQLTVLEDLYLSSNKLEGDIPQEIVNLSSLYELHLNYNRLVVPPGYPILGNPLHDFLQTHASAWQLYQMNEILISTATGGSLTSLDSRALLTVPSNAAESDFLLRYIPLGYLPVTLNPLGVNFTVEAEIVGKELITRFDQPIIVRLKYYYNGSMPEDQIYLYWWNPASKTWVDARTNCDPNGEYVRDFVNQTVSLPVCAVGTYSLNHGKIKQIYLPVIVH